MALINIGKVNRKFLIPIFAGLSRLILRFILNNNSKYKIAAKNPFLLSIYTAIGMILAFIPYLILKYRSKKAIIYSKDLPNKSKLNVQFVHYDIFKKTRFNKYRLIAISTFFDFIATLMVYAFSMKCVYNLWIFDIIFINLFSYFLLKTKLYIY
mgnify:FL=1